MKNKKSLSAVITLTNLLLPYVKHTDAYLNMYPELSEPERHAY